MTGRSRWGAVSALVSLLAMAGVWGARLEAQEEPAARPEPTLLVFAFAGADADLVQRVATRVARDLDVAVTVLAAHPVPDEAGAFDRRARDLPRLAEALGLDPQGEPAALERRIRAALRKDRRPQARQAEAVVDDVCRLKLSVETLTRQAATVAGEQLQRPGVIGVVGVTDRDLAGPDVNFYFGSGNRQAKAGVISSLRFQEGAKGEQLEHRVAVQLLSTTGVLLGLGRCGEASCARAFPSSLDEHDRKQEAFCAACQRTVKAALGR